MSSQISDIVEGFSPIRLSFCNLRSLVESYDFGIGGFVLQDPAQFEPIIKKFKNELLNLINQIDNGLGDYENIVTNHGFSETLPNYEDVIEDLRQSLKLLDEKNCRLIRENDILHDEIQASKANIKLRRFSTFETKKGNLSNFKDGLVDSKSTMNRSKFISDKKQLFQEDDKIFLIEAFKLKKKEIDGLKKENMELSKNLNMVHKEHMVSVSLLKQCKKELQRNKIEIRKYQSKENEDNMDFGNIKDQLVNAKSEIKKQQDQLKIDYELIKVLKDELINLHQQVKAMVTEKEELLDDPEKRAEIYGNIELLQESSKDQNHFETIGINRELAKNKKNLVVEFELMKTELNRVRKELQENKNKLIITENDSQSFANKVDTLNRDLVECKSKVNILSTMKMISEEKIKLLNQFIEDFRVKELQFQNKRISEDNQNRLKIGIMQQAYNKLF